jgi:hypothetical protein
MAGHIPDKGRWPSTRAHDFENVYDEEILDFSHAFFYDPVY